MISGAKDAAMTQAPAEQRDAVRQATIQMGRDMYGLDLRQATPGPDGLALR